MSGRITIDNLSDSLKELINQAGLTEEQVINLINVNGLTEEQVISLVKDNLTGDLTQLSTTNKTNIVAAINELFQSANNGKELIATAIGEPLNSEDTFSAMSTGINGLLSTFKTNMMKNGITVESSDKFKALIDKIATLVDNEGKGVQYQTGTVESSSSKPNYLTSVSSGAVSFKPAYTVSVTNLPFRPIFVILQYSSQLSVCDGNYAVTTSSEGTITVFPCDLSYSSYSTMYIHDNSFEIGISRGNTTCTYHIIGVGEEDTTLRDSLASILEDEGVEVLEEDTMASLISKVDEEFDRKIDVKSGSYISPITMTEDIRKITITHNLGKAPSFISIYIPYTSLYYLYGGYENYLQASTTRAMNYIIDSRVYYDVDHRFIVLADSNRYMHAYITDITNTSFSFAMCCGKEGSGYEIHLDSFDWVVM